MHSPELDTEILIIGAGISGLACALLLSEKGRQVRVIEARANPGGRIRSLFDQTTGAYLADLGPTWIWPDFQPTVSRWLEKLALETFPQFDSGKAILDQGPNTVPVIQAIPGQTGSLRVRGGSQAIIDALVARLPEQTLVNDAPIVSITKSTKGMQARIAEAQSGATLTCERVIVAVPPRIAVDTIHWIPALPEPLARALRGIPTWMAPHAKAVALYDTPFWREQGLSGRIASGVGPIVEAHDHCGPDATPGVIFGFIGWPHDVRKRIGAELEAHVGAQLERCFGPNSPAPRAIQIEEWASDPLVTSPGDLSEPMIHPGVGPPVVREAHMGGRLLFAGAESATISPGLIEGAFDAAERVAAAIEAAP